MASLVCLLFFLPAATSSAAGRLVPYDLLYADGVRAYFARDWGRAAELLQRALHSYAGLRAARLACRDACLREAAFLGEPPAAGPWEAALFDRVLQRADCLQHCLGSRLGAAPSAHRASLVIQRDFERREPYNYLQVAFFQVGLPSGPGGGGPGEGIGGAAAGLGDRAGDLQHSVHAAVGGQRGAPPSVGKPG